MNTGSNCEGQCSWAPGSPLRGAPERQATSNLSSPSNIGEIAVAAFALRKARGARGAFALEHRRGAGPFRAQGFALGPPFLQPHRAPVGTQPRLRESRDLVRQRLRDLARLSARGEPLAQTDAQAFLRRHLAAGENDVERAAAPDDAR